MRTILFGITLLLIISCKTESNHLQILNKIRRVSDLATTEVSIKKYVLANKEKKVALIPLKDATFAAETYAYLKFGISLEEISKEDISIEEKTLTIKVREVKLISFDYPPNEHREIAKMTNRKRFGNTLSFNEIDVAFQEAQEQIGKSVEYFNVLTTIKNNTENALLGLLAPHDIDVVILVIESNTINKTRYF